MKKRFFLTIPALLVFFLSGCSTLMTGGMVASSYGNAPLILMYPAPDVIRDQSQVATLVIPMKFGVTVDGVPIKKWDGDFYPNLRIADGEAPAYIVDLLPGTHTLAVSYDAITTGDSNPQSTTVYKGRTTSVSASVSGLKLFSWIRTSETSHDLKGGEAYAVNLKLLTVSGEIDLYALDDSASAAVIEARNKAQFPQTTTP